MSIKITGLICAILLMAACGSDQHGAGSGNDLNQVAAEQRKSEPMGQFRATLGDKSYDLEVRCLNLEKEFFAFSSDSKDGAAPRGKRVIVSGMQSLDSLMLKIMDGGETWNARSISSWEKSASGAIGSGQMLRDSDSSPLEMTFELTCK
jgi:hypothetical protein